MSIQKSQNTHFCGLCGNYELWKFDAEVTKSRCPAPSAPTIEWPNALYPDVSESFGEKRGDRYCTGE
jgi:hypothetical protein